MASAPTRARSRVMRHLDDIRSGAVVVSTCTLLSSAIACDPGPPPAICPREPPTVLAAVADQGQIQVDVDLPTGALAGEIGFLQVTGDDVRDATLDSVEGGDYLELRVEPDPGATQVTIRVGLDCVESSDLATNPTYAIALALPKDPAPGDPVPATIESE